ncbi:endonuclease-reverse transcriptase [Elysia marginata]|uniref:Endonuclease-reverse transcriptase n=1 Tax=Elysia marginata TaxID=1093978 RepID=A0AAV4JKF6_9GAST|nr:endonuclease-reverse transcriptase [Elysia marginata]
MQNLENCPGIKVGGYNVNNIKYADDTVLVAENKDDLQKLLNIVEEESSDGNQSETRTSKCDIFINDAILKQQDKFKYLGTIITSDGRNNNEIAARIAQAKTNFQKMRAVLTNKHISIQTRKRVLRCYIEPILLYGCEAWTISKQIEAKLEATELWFLRRMLRIFWT